MKKKLNYNKKFMSKVNVILNKIEKTKKSQRYIMNIGNIENHFIAQFRCNNFEKIAYIHFCISLGLEKFPDLETVGKQDYSIALNSQEIESILIEYDKIMLSESGRKNMKSSSFKNVFRPVLNGLKNILQGE